MPFSTRKFATLEYISTTPEKLWAALTEADVTKAYWAGHGPNSAHVNVSDWKPGSLWEHRRADGSGVVDITGKVIEQQTRLYSGFTAQPWSSPPVESTPSRTT